MRKLQAWLMAVLILGFGLSASAVTTQKWELLRFEDFSRGKLQSLRLSAEGRLSLGSKVETISGPAEDFYLSFVAAPDGSLYLGTGHNGRVYRLKGGKVELYFQAPEMDVTCLALDSKGVLYAGTSPNGKIYRITGVGQGDSFFNPEEKYIWDLLFSEKGTLLAAVGERGGIYEISLLGEGKLLFKSEETHILCLHRLASGDTYAGSGGPGSLYLIKPGGKPALLYESSYEEIKAITTDSSGNIYIAASGTPTKPRPKEPATPGAKVLSATDVAVTVIAAGPEKPATATPGGEAREPGAVYQIKPDGLAKRLWSSNEEMAYSLAFRPEEKKLYFGTGAKGRVYSVDSEDRVSLVYQGQFEQVYELFASGSKLFFLGNNPNVLGSLLPEQSLEGEYLSPVLESSTITLWGRLEWLAEIPAGCSLLFQSRSGNSSRPNETWSDWSPPYQKMGEQILSPKARYLQIKALFRSQAGNASPVLQRLTLFYLPANLPPALTSLEVLGPNEVFLKPPDQEEVIWGLPTIKKSDQTGREEGRIVSLAARKVGRKGYQTFRWEANDENGDELVFQVYLRKEGEADWRLLADNWNESIYVLEATTFPDGVYELKVVASDSPSNPPSQELKAEKISLPFIIDNTPPIIKNVLASLKGNELELSFEAEDNGSAISKAEFLVQPEPWRAIFPVDGLCDGPRESFRVKIALKPGADKMAVIRVQDRYGNVAVFWQNF